MQQMDKTLHDKPIREWLVQHPVLADVIAAKPTLWINNTLPFFAEAEAFIGFNRADVKDAADRLDRFRPYIARAFPETAVAGGQIESPLSPIPAMHTAMEDRYNTTLFGKLFVKLDSHLPISGSIKARGGIYEILKFAETTAISGGLLKKSDNYALLDSVQCRELFSHYSIVVGSTGNLGLSIGIIGAKLGFQVTVHLSAEAKQWKKQLLRDMGVSLVEHVSDYSGAVARGREQAGTDPLGHFVDDENSGDLFLGYATAAERLRAQLQQQSIRVDKDHPLIVYLPCGVGGGPGGVTFGLKLAFGDNVHCFFGEPTQSPAMLLGLATGLHGNISARELGLENNTIADGLAVSRPSALVSRIMQHLLSGVYTTADDEIYRLLALLAQSEDLHLEPSAVVGFAGLPRVRQLQKNLHLCHGQQQRTTHLVWATGGSMVPESVWQKDFRQGRRFLEST
jgi:D-serine dehydratase